MKPTTFEQRTTEHQKSTGIEAVAGTPAAATVWAWDIDGTLYEPPADGAGYSSPAAVAAAAPIEPAIHLARALVDAGIRCEYVTGRGLALQDVTLEQLRRDIQPDLDEDQVHMQERWTSWRAMLGHKATTLERIRAAVYVGDQPLDCEAANLAGCTFLHAPVLQGLVPVEVWT